MLQVARNEHCACRPQMLPYRAYFFDTQRHIVDCREFDAGNHQEALDTARQWVDGRSIEIWCGSELVATLLPARRRPPRITTEVVGTRLPGAVRVHAILGRRKPHRVRLCRHRPLPT